MKRRINIMLSEKALQIADQGGNRSEFIEDLILGMPQSQKTDNSSITEQRIIELIKEHSEFKPAPPDPDTGYPCCEKKVPCKHWAFNGENWLNSITGKEREIET
jgi:hypothetical protein